jgi:uncharacterized protein YndB with AHSA1/START domain
MDTTVQQRPSLSIRRQYAAPPEKVWKALITPAALKLEKGWNVCLARLELYVGGKA